MGNNKQTNVLIIGAGTGGLALLKMFEKSDEIEVLGIVDINLKAPGIKYAKEKEILTSDNYKLFLNNEKLDEIINVTGSDSVQNELIQYKPKDVEIVGGKTAKFMWDIVELHEKLEEELKISQEKYKQIINTTYDMICSYDISGTVSFVGPQVKRYGYTQEEVIGNNIFQFIHPDDHENVKKELERTITTGEEFLSQLRLLTKNGNIVWVEDLGKVQRDSKNKVIGINTVLRDITDRKKAEDRINNLNNTLLNFSENSEENINSLVKLCGESLNASCALYNFFDGENLIAVGIWNTPPHFISECKAEGHICAEVIKEGSKNVLVLENLSKTKFHKTDPNIKKYKLKTYIGKSVEVDGKSIGSLCVAYMDSYKPSEEDKRFIQIIASALGSEEERRLSQEKISESEEKYRSLFDNSINAFALHKIVVDESGEPIDYIFLEVNKSFEKITGLKAKNIIGEKVSKILPGIENTPFIETYGRVAQSGNPIRFEQYSPQLKKYFDISAYSTRPGYFATIFTDITEEKQVRKILRESEERYRTLVATSPNAILVHSNEKIVYINPQAIKILGGKSADDFIGKSIYKILHKNYHKLVSKEIKKSYDKSKPIQNLKERIVKLDGTVIDVDISRTSINFAGKPSAQIVFKDITETLKTEEVIKESEKRYRTLFESSRDGIVFTDMEGNIINANQTYLDMLGYTLDEIKTINYKDYTPEKWRKSENRIVKEKIIATGFSGEYEKEYIKKDGSIFPVTLTSWLLRDDNNNPIGMWGIARDITEQKKTESEIKDKITKLERFNRIAVGRELKMKELKNRIKELEEALKIK